MTQVALIQWSESYRQPYADTLHVFKEAMGSGDAALQAEFQELSLATYRDEQVEGLFAALRPSFAAHDCSIANT